MSTATVGTSARLAALELTDVVIPACPPTQSSYRTMAPLLRIGLPAALYLALFTAVSTASPLPAGAPVPSVFTLAPLYTPGPPPSSSYADEALAQINTLSHIIRDSYIIVLQDHLEPHHVEAHHAQVAALHSSDASMRALQSADDATLDVPALEGVVHKYSIGKKARSGKKALVGYAGKFSESSVDAIRAMEGVKYVERDSVVYASEIERGAPWVSPVSVVGVVEPPADPRPLVRRDSLGSRTAHRCRSARSTSTSLMATEERESTPTLSIRESSRSRSPAHADLPTPLAESTLPTRSLRVVPSGARPFPRTPTRT